jgi:hypothetical protein
MPSGHHDCKKVARQIKTGYCLKKISAWPVHFFLSL